MVNEVGNLISISRYRRCFTLSLIAIGLAAVVIGSVGSRQVQKSENLAAQVVPADTALQNTEVVKQEVRPKIQSYTVAEGDNLGEIAERYMIDVDTILGANPQLDRELIHPGQQLVILGEKGVLHTVAEGQTLWSIGRQYGVEWQRIQAANPDIDMEALQPGCQLLVPGGRMKAVEAEVSRGSFSPDFYWPAQGSVSSPYGFRWGRLHAGIDVAADTGDYIRAAHSGRVTFAGWNGGYGLCVIVDHGRGWETLYGHANELYVTSGDTVRGGEHIADVGDTGYSTGPHLHFEVHYQGVPRDPLQYLP